MEYKATWAGGRVIAVPAMNTSRACPCCGHVSKDNRKTQANFVCVGCGLAANADYVASLNILAAGLAVFEGSALTILLILTTLAVLIGLSRIPTKVAPR